MIDRQTPSSFNQRDTKVAIFDNFDSRRFLRYDPGLHWYDLKAKPKPVFSGNRIPERIGSLNGIATFQNQALATTRGGYLLLDREEPRSASEIGIHPVGELRRHLGVPSVYGNRLYTAHRAEGKITVIDIQDPAKPVLLEELGS